MNLLLKLDLAVQLLQLDMLVVVLQLHRLEALYHVPVAYVLLRDRRQHILHEVLTKALVRGDLKICNELANGLRVASEARSYKVSVRLQLQHDCLNFRHLYEPRRLRVILLPYFLELFDLDLEDLEAFFLV